MAVIATTWCCSASIRKFTFLLGFCSLLIAMQVGAGTNECRIKDKQYDWLKGLDLPAVQTKGSICGSNSCCGPNAENHLSKVSRKEVEKFLRDSTSQVSSLLETRAKRFEELFKDMMMKSKKEFHAMFERTYGIIYLQNSDVFIDFFSELEKYYSQGKVNLSETMDHFFQILYQRMFKVINSQYTFSEEYLNCVVKDIAKLRPFGDIPAKLGVLLKRSFLATKVFHKSIAKGAVVADKMMSLNLSQDCASDVTRMRYCDKCTGLNEPGTCPPYCTDTLKSCFRLFISISDHWDRYIDALDKVAEKLLGAFNIELVVDPINIKISEAIMNFQDSGEDVSKKVYAECGKPERAVAPASGKRRRRRDTGSHVETKGNVPLGGSGSSTNGEVTYQPLKFNNNTKRKNKNKTNSYSPQQSVMEKRIIEVRQKIKETKNFWNHLPYQYCNNISTAPADEPKCWNGTTADQLPPVQTHLSTEKPPILSEQLYALDLLIYNLKQAYQGQDVDETDEEDEDTISPSGSGSGDGEHFDEDVDATTSTPSSSSSSESPKITTTEDIAVILNEDIVPVVTTASASELTKALLHYILPIVMVWFGGAITELL